MIQNRVTKEVWYSCIPDHYRDLTEKNNGDQKKMWKAINGVLDKDIESITTSNREVGGKYLTKERDVFEAVTCHFISVGPNLAKSVETRPNDSYRQHIKPVNNDMPFKTVAKTYVMKAINHLKNGKVFVPGNVTVTLPTDASEYIAHTLC